MGDSQRAGGKDPRMKAVVSLAIVCATVIVAMQVDEGLMHTANSGACANSKVWRVKGTQNGCDWVAWENTPGMRCAQVDAHGVPAHQACRLSCGTCPPSKSELAASHIQDDIIDEESSDTLEDDKQVADFSTTQVVS